MAERVPVLKISLANATFLSGAYLLLATVVEVVRRVFNPRWIEGLSLSLEAFPARVLSFLGLFQPLETAWMENRVSELTVRLVYGVTVVGLIFLLGAFVGLAMGLVARRLEARADGEPGDGTGPGGDGPGPQA